MTLVTHLDGLASERQPVPGSFRDRSGFVFFRDGVPYRQVNRCYQNHYDLLIGSGLYEELVGKKFLISHEVTENHAVDDDVYKVIRPVKLPFVSYPYEWCFSQLKEAALTTLQVQKLALQRGMSLKDASAYNVQFLDGRMTFIDTLSFEPYEEGKPWIAYGQFCQHFLAPLALMSKSDKRLGQLLRCYIDGIPLDMASKLLPWKTILNPGLGLHLHAQARLQVKLDGNHRPHDSNAPSLSRKSLELVLHSLEKSIKRLNWPTDRSRWSNYYTDMHNYDPHAMHQKERIVREVAHAVSPQSVWDLGGNTGRFSRIAAGSGAYVVCWDNDIECVEKAYQVVRAKNETGIQPLVLDLTNPSPALGWAHSERASLVERGPVDLLLALGLVHHLAIGNNVPLFRVAQFLSSIGRHVIVEFVPKSDSQIHGMLANRTDSFFDYHQAGFEYAFSSFFRFAPPIQLSASDRLIYIMERTS